VLSVLLLFTNSDFPFRIFKFSLQIFPKFGLCLKFGLYRIPVYSGLGLHRIPVYSGFGLDRIYLYNLFITQIIAEYCSVVYFILTLFSSWEVD
jgi:hypothetical protein